jgi:hypothetical protein
MPTHVGHILLIDGGDQLAFSFFLSLSGSGGQSFSASDAGGLNVLGQGFLQFVITCSKTLPVFFSGVHSVEGIVCKEKDLLYKVTEEPSRYWIKVKNPRYSQLERHEELFERV